MTTDGLTNPLTRCLLLTWIDYFNSQWPPRKHCEPCFCWLITRVISHLCVEQEQCANPANRSIRDSGMWYVGVGQTRKQRAAATPSKREKIVSSPESVNGRRALESDPGCKREQFQGMSANYRLHAYPPAPSLPTDQRVAVWTSQGRSSFPETARHQSIKTNKSHRV
jgi:hypothetical protein